MEVNYSCLPVARWRPLQFCDEVFAFSNQSVLFSFASPSSLYWTPSSCSMSIRKRQHIPDTLSLFSCLQLSSRVSRVLLEWEKMNSLCVYPNLTAAARMPLMLRWACSSRKNTLVCSEPGAQNQQREFRDDGGEAGTGMERQMQFVPTRAEKQVKYQERVPQLSNLALFKTRHTFRQKLECGCVQNFLKLIQTLIDQSRRQRSKTSTPPIQDVPVWD